MNCGKCGKAFNALDYLHDDHPDRSGEQEFPDTPDTPPVLGDPDSLDSDDQLASLLASRPSHQPAPSNNRAWLVLLTALMLLSLANLAWTYRLHLGATQVDVVEESSIRLVSRDFHAHPTREGVLVLSASFVSLADSPQAFPSLSITLLDADDRPLARREFEPAEYLLAGVDHGSPLKPDVHIPILLEFQDPGEKAVGFELEFH